jgi:2-phosphosulfolactate phosphatase
MPHARIVQDLGADGGTVVVVDVIRAFTTAAAAFAAGAERVVCVGSEAEARARSGDGGAVLAGERDGLRAEGFDLGNSPLEAAAAPLTGATVVLMTQNGTAALARAATTAASVVAAAAVNVTATASWILRHRPDAPVTILCSGGRDDDRACAEHLAALLAGEAPSAAATRDRVLASIPALLEEEWRPFHTPASCRAFEDDARVCAEVDAHPVAMVGRRVAGAVELRGVV